MRRTERTELGRKPGPKSTRPAAPQAASGAADALGAVPVSRYIVFFGIAILATTLDLATKTWIFGRLGFPPRDRIWIWTDVLSLETGLNEGALFGMFQGQVPVFATLSVAAGIGILLWLFWFRAAWDLWLTVALGSVSAGICGNLYDRLGLHGLTWSFGDRMGQPVYAVRDWIHFKIELFDWPVFNLADSFLVCGVAMLVVQSLWVESPAASTPKAGAAAAGQVPGTH